MIAYDVNVWYTHDYFDRVTRIKCLEWNLISCFEVGSLRILYIHFMYVLGLHLGAASQRKWTCGGSNMPSLGVCREMLSVHHARMKRVIKFEHIYVLEIIGRIDRASLIYICTYYMRTRMSDVLFLPLIQTFNYLLVCFFIIIFISPNSTTCNKSGKRRIYHSSILVLFSSFSLLILN